MRTLLVRHERGTLISPGLGSRHLPNIFLSILELLITIGVFTIEANLLVETPAGQLNDQSQGIVVGELEKE